MAAELAWRSQSDIATNHVEHVTYRKIGWLQLGALECWNSPIAAVIRCEKAGIIQKTQKHTYVFRNGHWRSRFHVGA